jgi:DNA-binding NtrC family response regulator
LGETGTGKGAAAAAIGLSGFIPFEPKRSAFAHGFRESFVPIHLNEYPESLFESEIFGHRKGAFTGAVDNHEGVLARCKPHGTVFFDEIGEATLPVQVKLLRVLQDRVYAPVGSRERQRFSGRIVAATHRSLSELRAEGAMRDDFYYRLCSNVIEVPPLRVRIAEAPSELDELVSHLCTRITGSGGAELASEVVAALQRDLGARYAFPGNVRELEQCVRRVLINGSCVRDEKIASGKGSALGARLERGELDAESLLDLYCALLYARSSSYVEVARITGLDRRTVKKHVDRQAGTDEPSA